jgi:hypothetical protein
MNVAATRTAVWAGIGATAWLVACGAGGSSNPTASIQVDGTPLTVEVVDNDGTRALGLMYRESMPADRGMVFVYDDDAVRSFWMKDTRIPLSIAYVDYAGSILHIADMTPLNTNSVPSRYPVRYAIEVNRGWFAEHGVEVGDKVTGLKELPRTAK